MLKLIGIVIITFIGICRCLDNGLAHTPPMGWLSWERFRCNTDCENDPENCISENLFKNMADLLVTEGYADAGYNFINIDDCWMSRQRGNDGRLKPDENRFPSGIKSLSDYIHSRGLKFGIYANYGNYTCAGYPGSLNYEKIDADTFANWNVDFVKFDGCFSNPIDMDEGYPKFGYYLNKTGRSMIFSCSWPVYQIYARMQPKYQQILKHCNLWRNFDDIQDSWNSVESIIDYFGNNQDLLAPLAGPGHWNDPDMLIIGNFGLSYEQSKTQMAIWAIIAAPLLMSNDLRTIKPEFKNILQNRKIIQVNQDLLGIQGRRIYKYNKIEIWSKPINPVKKDYFSYAIAFVNRRADGTPSDISVTLKELGLVSHSGYQIEDLYEDVDYGVLSPTTRIKVKVNPSGVVLLRAKVYDSRLDNNRNKYTYRYYNN